MAKCHKISEHHKLQHLCSMHPESGAQHNSIKRNVCHSSLHKEKIASRKQVATPPSSLSELVTIIMDGHCEQQPHFVLVPFMAQGHMIPMIDLALLLAGRGALISFITTPVNASRIKDTIRQAEESSLPIRFIELQFPCSEAGLPEGCENIDVLPTLEVLLNFFRATSLLQQPLELHLTAQQPYPSCIISDFCHPWTREVASSLRVPRLTFYSVCCFTLLCHFNLCHDGVYDRIADDNEPFLVPGLAEGIEVTKAQAPGFFPRPFFAKIGEDVQEADFAADGIVVNSFEDLERSFIEGYQKAMGRRVWTVGPLSLSNKSIANMAVRGSKASIDAGHCLSWLDAMKPRSVFYVCFGSLTRAEQLSQTMEIGLGLEASMQPFIWVIKSGKESAEKVEEWLAGGFEERVSSRGLVIKGWAPQVMILSHPAVGGFMTHCGWNSTLEGITAGVPMITWPHFADQFLNERMVVDVLRIGVPVGVKLPYYFRFEKNETVVRREDVEKAVRSLMDEGKEGEERRKRAKELGEKAREAMREGGSSYSNMSQMIRHFAGNASTDVQKKEL